MKKSIFIASAFVWFFGSLYVLSASETNGTILDANKLTKICKNVSCSDFGNVNWKPTLNANTTGATAVSVTDSGLSGHLWGDEIGWVNLSPTGAGVLVNPNTGALNGTAYASVGGWINFNPTGAGVTLVDNGSGSDFYGWAYVSGINGGWMKFDCTDGSTCIKTDWRSVPNRAGGEEEEESGSSGGSGGGRSSPTSPSVNEEVTVPPVLLPEIAYENFPGAGQFTGGNSNPANVGENGEQGEPVFFNPYEEYPELGGRNLSGQNLGEKIKCPSLENLSCVWENKYFMGISAFVLFLILILLGRWAWKRFI